MKYSIGQIEFASSISFDRKDVGVVAKESSLFGNYINHMQLLRGIGEHPFTVKVNGDIGCIAKGPVTLPDIQCFKVRYEIYQYKEEFNEIFSWLKIQDKPSSVGIQLEVGVVNKQRVLKKLNLHHITVYQDKTSTSFCSYSAGDSYSFSNPALMTKLLTLICLPFKTAFYFEDLTLSFDMLKQRILEDSLFDNQNNKDIIRSVIKDVTKKLSEIFGKALQIDYLSERSSPFAYCFSGEKQVTIFNATDNDSFLILLAIYLSLRMKTSTPSSLIFFKDISMLIPKKMFSKYYPFFSGQGIQIIAACNIASSLQIMFENGSLIIK